MKNTTKNLLLLIKLELDALDTECAEIEELLSEEDRKLFFNIYVIHAKIEDLVKAAVEFENKNNAH